MKKNLTLILVAISVLSMAFSMAFSSPGKKVIRLLGVYFSGNTVVMKFDTKGLTPRSDVRASITIDKLNYPLSCVYDGSRHIVCKMDNMKRYEGLPARVWLSGYVFYTQIPWK